MNNLLCTERTPEQLQTVQSLRQMTCSECGHVLCQVAHALAVKPSRWAESAREVPKHAIFITL